METRVEIDRLKDVYHEYAVRGFGQSKWSVANRGNQAILGERLLKTREFLQKTGFLPLENRRILDVGCGTGELLNVFENWGARPDNLFGIDLIPDRIRAAQMNFPGFTFQLANAETLPFADRTFDLVSVFTVFTSILSRRMALNIGLEIDRILSSGGGVIWYDFRLDNPFNQHVRRITRKNVQRLFPGFKVSLETISLLPPLARRLGSLTNLLYPRLSSFPFLRSHYLGVLQKP
jgi:ubiquinone/menaquinone biosynthesis C-methylase UbiE